MLKNIVPSLLLAGAVFAPVAAADASAAGPYVGFEFGFNFNLYNDDKIDGAATTFALTFPVSSNFSASVVHERGNATIKNNGAQSDVDTEANEIRATYQVWGSDTQAVKLFMGFGNIQYSGGINDTGLLGDLGAQYIPVKSKTGPVTGQLDIHANYRYAKISQVTVAGADIDDVGGFQIGLGVGLFF